MSSSFSNFLLTCQAANCWRERLTLLTMKKSAHEALADNLKRLMDHEGWSQADLERKAGVAQTTISNMLDTERCVSSTMRNIERVAAVWKLEAWQLLIPDQPIDILKAQSLRNVVTSYTHMSKAGRDYIDHVAERETGKSTDL